MENGISYLVVVLHLWIRACTPLYRTGIGRTHRPLILVSPDSRTSALDIIRFEESQGRLCRDHLYLDPLVLARVQGVHE
jgi:hypothetical protein